MGAEKFKKELLLDVSLKGLKSEAISMSTEGEKVKPVHTDLDMSSKVLKN
jgi:hypothetical protein